MSWNAENSCTLYQWKLILLGGHMPVKKHFSVPFIPKVRTDIWWPRRRICVGSNNFNSIHSEIKLIYVHVYMNKCLYKELSGWLNLYHLGFLFHLENQSKQWNVEIADKLRNKLATAASGHKKRLISCPWVCCWCTASAQHSSRLKCEKQCRQVCVWSNWMTFTQVPLRLRGKEP